jgi:serine/threonine-protein kinase
VEYLERHRQLDRLPDVDLSVFIASRVCRALQYVFERAAIVHRDVSPSNIMMTREGTVKIIDFGIATKAGTRDSGLTGKPAYMAPETIVDLRADNRSDLFSLGAVLYETLTLRRLFPGKDVGKVLEQVIAARVPSPLDVNPQVPDGVLSILQTALQRDPALRFGCAAEMGAACEHFLYDKGYGPTNLALKEYLAGLFPEAFGAPGTPHVQGEAAVVEPTLVPIADSAGDRTPATSQNGRRRVPTNARGDAPTTVSPPNEGTSRSVRRGGT